MDKLEKELHGLIWGFRRRVGLTVFQCSFVLFVTIDIILVRQICLFKAVILPVINNCISLTSCSFSETWRVAGSINSISQKEWSASNFSLLISMLYNTGKRQEVKTWSQMIYPIVDTLKTSHHYFYRKRIGATNENLSFDIRVWRVNKGI